LGRICKDGSRDDKRGKATSEFETPHRSSMGEIALAAQ
jgi:hypothetical protein